MVDYFGTDTVVSELRDDGLLIIRINRPEVANALNGVTSAAMENIMNHAENDKAVRAIVVTGTGKVFCAGEDLSELSEGGECQTVTEHGFGGLTARLCSKPVICACNGSAAGGGMEIALSCDMVVAAENAKFGCTEVGLGIIASTGGI
ncbi:MAG: enoyl-CoA hydratase/isomerase family protein, partial [Adlercreutzia sp.]